MNRFKSFALSLLIVVFSTVLTSFLIELFFYQLSKIKPIPFFLVSINKNLYFEKWFFPFSYGGECYEHSKKRFYDLKKGSICHFDNIEYSTLVSVGGYGERLNRSIGKDHNAKSVDVIAIGDSVTMGWGVNDNETYASALQGMLNTKVINLGVPSYNTSRELDKLINFPGSKNSNTVIIQYHINDAIENSSYIKNGPKNYSIQDYYNRQDAFDNTYGWHTGGYKFYDYTIRTIESLFNNKIFGFQKTDNSRDLRLEAETFFSILKKYPMLANKNIIIFDGSELELQHHDFKRVFSEASTSSGLKSVKVLDMDFTSNDYFILDNHQNISGHKKIAEKIYKAMMKSN